MSMQLCYAMHGEAAKTVFLKDNSVKVSLAPV